MVGTVRPHFLRESKVRHGRVSTEPKGVFSERLLPQLQVALLFESAAPMGYQGPLPSPDAPPP